MKEQDIAYTMYSLETTIAIAKLFQEVAGVGMQDVSRLIFLCNYALETQHLEGDIVEFGCFNGDTAKLISALTLKTVHLYDSFQGLPENSDNCMVGAMTTSREQVIDNFKRSNIRQPEIHPGWFSSLTDRDIPEKIAYAHLDGDLYASTFIPLSLIYDRLVPNAVILVDDYDAPWFPGTKRACDEFFSDRPEKVRALPGINGGPSYKGLVIKQGVRNGR